MIHKFFYLVDLQVIEYLIKNKDKDSEVRKIRIDGYTYDVPVYLILKKFPKSISNVVIKKSLYFTRNIILNRFFLPNNLPFPKSRVILENYFN